MGASSAMLGHLNTALHALVVLTSLTLAFSLFDNTLFAWHPIFMSIGYILFMSEGVLAAINFRAMEPSQERVQAIQGHALLQLRAVVCVCIGFGVIYRNKVLHGKHHFVSLHARLGLATFLLSLLAPLGGAIAFRRLGLIQSFPEAWQPRVKWAHRQLGLLVLLMALLTIETVLPNPHLRRGILTPAWQGSVAVIAGLVLLIAAKTPGQAERSDVLAKAV